ncbi:MAG: hypothetical protein BWY65_01858 [Firmicutes bacterium ADurb.Bin373]|nr:MAG: hypothetical protein BWY65_01858 [Firmicutes bacterium ADurb.Bin373]
MAILKHVADTLKGNEPLHVRYADGEKSLFTWTKRIPKNKTLIGEPIRLIFSNGEVLFKPGSKMYGLPDGSLLYTGQFSIRIKPRRSPAPN